MTVTCQICNGEGMCYHSNGVGPQRAKEKQVCPICGGTGKVKETPTKKLHIRKYWAVNV